MIELIQTYLIVSLIIYFFPFLLSLLTRNRVSGVFIMNLFLGWTFIGWFWALIWALTSERDKNQINVHNYLDTDKNENRELKIQIEKKTLPVQLVDKQSLLNQLTQLHDLKEKNVISDIIYEQERSIILIKLQGEQGKQSEVLPMIEPKVQLEEELKVNTTEKDDFNEENYKALFDKKNWVQRNKDGIIGILIAAVLGLSIWYFTNGNSNEEIIDTNNFISTSLDKLFSEYPAEVETLSKSPVDHQSHEYGKLYRTAIKEQYSANNIDFGGHYITISWGAGSGLTLGAMIDLKDGKIYELPLNEDNSYRGAYHDNNNNILYQANSNLFICYSSHNNPDDEKVDLTYYYYVWNEDKKIFKLIETNKLTTKRIDN